MRAVTIGLILAAVVAGFGYDEEIKRAYYDSYNYEKMADYEDAVKSLMPVYKAFPNAYTPNLRLGWLYYLNGQYANALMHYQKAASALKSAVRPKLGMADIYILQGKYDEASRLCNDILKSDYYNYYANLYLSRILALEKSYENALAVTYKMLALYPTDIAFLQRLAEVLQAQGRNDEAAKVYEDILILDPKNIAANDFFRRPSGEEKGGR